MPELQQYMDFNENNIEENLRLHVAIEDDHHDDQYAALSSSQTSPSSSASSSPSRPSSTSLSSSLSSSSSRSSSTHLSSSSKRKIVFLVFLFIVVLHKFLERFGYADQYLNFIENFLLKMIAIGSDMVIQQAFIFLLNLFQY
ncbi:unnamed protein product [Rotaria magnacalcarata]|uniref:Uncharacterized protein n=1 Tax=Rotaria magnacalcarata TaxID=392030 RepID=A0A814MCF8_9BILA|nr:unnamed protein product [Rotaria magnacalcarata]CAF1499015.1 unnamed protein product [Rotaria magnacalcarata]